MASRWERYLKRWVANGLVDAATAERIRSFEAKHKKAEGLRWPVLLAIGLGGLLLGAGVLLFVAAHWDKLTPSLRFGLVLTLVGFFHLGATFFSERFPALSTTFHAVGTICLGAGIFLAGQIFNLQEHWPSGVMLWAFGAWVAWALLRDWPQTALVAFLTPLWLCSEWVEATHQWNINSPMIAQGLLLLAISYLTAILPEKDSPERKALMWIGGIFIIPLAAQVPHNYFYSLGQQALPTGYLVAGWVAAFGLPLLLALWQRRGAVWINVLAALWVLALGTTGRYIGLREDLFINTWRQLGAYGLWTLGSLGLIAWGLREARKERINLGVAGFAITVLAFYFSTVMDKLDRAASLAGLGLLFVLGGWILEKTRRHLVSQMGRGQS